MLILILISVIIVSVASLVGLLFLSLKEKTFNKVITVLIGLASGAMLGGAFLHLMPEAIESDINGAWLLLLAGILVFFIIEKFLHWRHCHNGKCKIHSFAYLNLVGDGIHNFIDGIIISTSYILSIETGIASTIAILLHEIPQEIGDFGVLVYAGFSKRKALFYNFLSAIVALVGAFFGFLIRKNINIDYLLPFAAGGFVYIAASDLIPELKKTTKFSKSVFEFIFITLGMAVMLLIKILFE
ncbi:MAG: ZIP family metal transporter [Candidatus Woesearchaeota archaeon]